MACAWCVGDQQNVGKAGRWYDCLLAGARLAVSSAELPPTMVVATAADSIAAAQRCVTDGASVFCCAKHTSGLLLLQLVARPLQVAKAGRDWASIFGMNVQRSNSDVNSLVFGRFSQLHAVYAEDVLTHRDKSNDQ